MLIEPDLVVIVIELPYLFRIFVMSSIDATTLGKEAVRLGLIGEDQLQDALIDLGNKNAPAVDLLRHLERKGQLTPWQASKLLKGDTDGYFLGGYRLLYRIAAGSFGRVYRADNPRTGEVVAMKVLRRKWSNDPRKIELFEREGKVGMAMRHPSIVSIILVSQDVVTGQYYIVMEFVEGGNLRDFLAIRKKLSPTESLRLLEETASGLEYALSMGLTHRDLKPTNILISANKSAKLVDFGLAEIAGGAKEEGGEIDRTVDYAGLEKATGAKAGDPRSDIYFLGCTFHEMLTGRPLLTPTKDPRARMQRERFKVAELLNRDDPDLPPAVFDILVRMVAFDPAERYQTYDQLLNAITLARTELEGGVPRKPTPEGPPTIYVIEGNLKLQDAFRDKLKKAGYRVLIASDANRAAQRYSQQPFHGLIIDIGTAGEEGANAYMKVIREAQGRRLDCTGIVIINPDQEDIVHEIRSNEAGLILKRPVQMRQITDHLLNAIPVVSAE